MKKPDIKDLERSPFIVGEEKIARFSNFFLRGSGKTLMAFGLGGSVTSALYKTITESKTPLHEISLTEKSINQLSQLSPDLVDNIMSPSPLNMGMLIGGAALHAIIYATTHEQSKYIEEITTQGADRVLFSEHLTLNPANHLDYKKLLSKKIYSQHTYKFLDSIKTFKENTLNTFNKKDLEKPYAKNNSYSERYLTDLFSQENTNALHLIALLGKAKDSLSVKLKENELCSSDTIREIFNNSDDLCEVLSENLPNLREFLKEIENSLGDDAKYFIDNSDNYNKGKYEIFDLSIEAIKKTAKTVQSFNIHKQFAIQLQQICAKTSLISGDRTKPITIDELNSSIEDFRRFENIRNFGKDNKPYRDVSNLAKKIHDILVDYRDKFEKDASQNNSKKPNLKIFNRIKNEISLDIDLNDDFTNNFLQEYFPNVVIVEDVESQLKKEIFKEMENVADSLIRKKINKPYENGKLPKEDEKTVRQHYGLDPFQDMKTSDMAKKSLINVQRRMLQNIIEKENSEGILP